MKILGIDLYRQAVAKLEEEDALGPFRLPATEEDINSLEALLNVKLPKSYRLMLQEFGILMFPGQTIYGIGKSGVQTKGGSGVFFQTSVARERGQISQTMVRVMSSGYGPEFCIECGQFTADGEAQVYLVPADGDMKNATKEADSFGEFLLNEVTAVLIE